MTRFHARLGRLSGFLLLVLLLVGSTGRCSEPARFDPDAPRPKPITPPTAEAIDTAITRGVDFLVRRQEKNGAWGSARNTTGADIYAPAPGSHHAFRAAVTGLCIAALIESGDKRPEVTESLDRAETWMLENLPSLRRAEPAAIYNVWGHAYAIQGLVRMFGRHANDPALQERIKKLIEHQIGMLQRFETVNGGWCYYDLKALTQKPSGPTMSFVTGTVLVALADAREIGLKIPQRPIDRAMESIRRQRKKDFSYVYGDYLRLQPMRHINRTAGSVGRSQVCNLAMYRWHDEQTTLPVIRTWLDRLFAQNMWFDLGRKRPIPHESWMQISGYFYFYGHYYAAGCIGLLDPAERPYFQQHLAHIILRLQEKDGCWWDYPMYDYHQQYGTAFAILSLVACRPTT